MRLEDARVGQLGLGAAGFGIAALMRDAGVKRVLAPTRTRRAHERARERGIEIADLETVMREADVVVATTGRPGLIMPEMVRPGQVILALTNPVPEIEPDAALAAGAAFAADGTSVNNVLGYPGIFRGALDGRRTLDHERDEARRRAGDRREDRGSPIWCRTCSTAASTSTSPRPCARPRSPYRLLRGWICPAWRGAS